MRENILTNGLTLYTEESISLNENYVLHMDVRNSKICVTLSNNSYEVYSLTDSKLQKVLNLKAHLKTIIGVKFSHESDQLLYTGSEDGTVKLWDLRQNNGKHVNEFKDDTAGENNMKPLSCFDVAKNNLLCAGTEVVDGDSFILFWDIRKSTILGGYWESHNDDITQVTFHKSNSNQLASASTDGLVNVFNLAETTEDDALQFTLNTESSVDKINWFSKSGSDAISCITHTEVLKLWKINDDDSYAVFERETIAEHLQCKKDDCYVASTHEVEYENGENDLIIIAGSNDEVERCLHVLKVNEKELESITQLVGNKQIVRTSYYNNKDKILIAAGETGIISIWKPEFKENSIASKNKLEMKSYVRHKIKPY